MLWWCKCYGTLRWCKSWNGGFVDCFVRSSVLIIDIGFTFIRWWVRFWHDGYESNSLSSKQVSHMWLVISITRSLIMIKQSSISFERTVLQIVRRLSSSCHPIPHDWLIDSNRSISMLSNMTHFIMLIRMSFEQCYMMIKWHVMTSRLIEWKQMNNQKNTAKSRDLVRGLLTLMISYELRMSSYELVRGTINVNKVVINVDRKVLMPLVTLALFKIPRIPDTRTKLLTLMRVKLLLNYIII